MKFSTRQDIGLPASELFQAITRFRDLERMLQRRRATVRRQDAMAPPDVGASWMIGFRWRGRDRELDMALSRLEAPEVMAFEGGSDQFGIALRMTVVALTPRKSRLICETEVVPRGVAARLILQTARLGKGQLDRKYAHQVADLLDKLTATGRPDPGFSPIPQVIGMARACAARSGSAG
ncbi:hypothetical protein [Paracoccus sp. (in: a-proteobacteria)]|uniref:hypothetical protein n=1 Tax=Paracoccus sp. TaxID=267 RepID=UPI00321FDB33